MKNITTKSEFLNKVYEYQQGIEDFIVLIDYTMLSPEATEEDIIGLCERAKDYDVATVCVLPKMVTVAKNELNDSTIGITTVISFPEGTDSAESKMSECRQAIDDGTDDIDMVLNYQQLKDEWNDDAKNGGDLEIYKSQMLVDEVKALVDICHSNNKILKVIVESGLLTEKQTEVATIICLKAGADFIKTSTGMISGPGAELDKIKIFYDTIKENDSDMLIKASGGIRTIEDIIKFSPYVDRFGVGSGSVDNMMGNSVEESSY